MREGGSDGGRRGGSRGLTVTTKIPLHPTPRPRYREPDRAWFALPSPARAYPSMSGLVNFATSDPRYGFSLPSHFEVGPTQKEPHRGPFDLQAASIKDLPLPLREDFQHASDAFDGKCFVRFPRRTDQQMERPVSGRAARYRFEAMPFESCWLPHYCVIGDNNLQLARLQRKVVRRSASLVGVGSKVL